MNHLKIVFAILLMLIIVVAAVQNYEAFSTALNLKLNLLLFRYESAGVSVYLVALVAFTIGLLSSGLYGMLERFRFKKQIRNLQMDAKEKEMELNSLRNLPVTTEDIRSDHASDVG